MTIVGSRNFGSSHGRRGLILIAAVRWFMYTYSAPNVVIIKLSFKFVRSADIRRYGPFLRVAFLLTHSDLIYLRLQGCLTAWNSPTSAQLVPFIL
ncbi:hypothetical protein BC835DRAFT_768531 [Cytidiella melzeri]|nr:hypothetical protein BC835DRAFT_768531 [Cytidiella melzeri]